MKLESITEKMEKVCGLKSIEKFIELNASFHDELWKSVLNKFLVEILNFVRDKKERLLKSVKGKILKRFFSLL